MSPGYYFVAFVDLLGQSDALATLGRIPKTDEERTTIFRTLSETGQVVRNVRNSFVDYFSRREALPIILDRVRPDKREEFARIYSLQVFQTGFSDSFVIGVPLQAVVPEPNAEAFARSVNDLWNALFGLACLSLAALQQGIPLRAGVDVGLGVEMFPNEVYGPVLLSAYRLESQVAEYPRAVIGENLFAYLSLLEGLAQDSPLNVYTASRARHCREFICAAPDDGWPMLHILSPIVTAAPGEFVESRRVAYEWLQEQVRRYGAERNGKLFRRYMRLARYFDSYK